MMILNPEDELLLECIKASIHKSNNELDSKIDSVQNWNSFLHIAIHNRLASLAYYVLSSSSLFIRIPESIGIELQKHYYKTVSKNAILYNEFENILAKWNCLSIEVVALKGIFLAENVYENIGIRPLSDIDVFVNDKDAETCANILLSLGYKWDKNLIKSEFILAKKDVKHLPMLHKNGIGFEIHSSLIITDDSFHIPINDFWENTQHFGVSNRSVLAFNPNYLLLHICMHLDEHFVDANIHFISYMDILWITEKYKSDINWIRFDEMCTQYNCTANVFPHLYLSYKYLNASISERILDKAQSLCTEYYDNYFVNKLQANSDFSPSKKNRNISELKKISGFWNRIQFLFDDMFPSKHFMITRYKIKNTKNVYWYYVVRQCDGVKSFLHYFLQRN